MTGRSFGVAALAVLLLLAGCSDSDLAAGGVDGGGAEPSAGAGVVGGAGDESESNPAPAGRGERRDAESGSSPDARRGSDAPREIVLADDPPAEDAATPPPIDDDRDELDDDGEPIELDAGSALACAAIEIGRDAALDGDHLRAVLLAARVDDGAIGDARIRIIAIAQAGADRAEPDLLANGVARCEALGYETAS